VAVTCSAASKGEVAVDDVVGLLFTASILVLFQTLTKRSREVIGHKRRTSNPLVCFRKRIYDRAR